jgi:hypothetical protein
VYPKEIVAAAITTARPHHHHPARMSWFPPMRKKTKTQETEIACGHVSFVAAVAASSRGHSALQNTLPRYLSNPLGSKTTCKSRQPSKY